MLIRLAGFSAGVVILLSLGGPSPAFADDGIGTGAWGSVKPVPTGALLAVGTVPSPPPAGSPPPVAQPAEAAPSGPVQAPGLLAARRDNAGAAVGSGGGCTSALSDIPQTRPGGAYYDVQCLAAAAAGGTTFQSQGTVWVPNPGMGPGPGAALPPPPLPPPAEVLAREAADQLLLPAPNVQMSPPAARDQVVGFPTWLWLGEGSFTAASRTVAVPGESVTASAVPVSASWVMGDGSTVTCTGAGKPFTSAASPSAASPDCGHTYLRPSVGQPGDRYPVTVTTQWRISWAGAGRTGVLPDLSRTAMVSLRVAEVQTVNS